MRVSNAFFTLPTNAKWAFTTRRVQRSRIAALRPEVEYAVSGDLVLATVIKIGQHKRIQLAEGRFSTSYIGDHVVLACGDRYAPDQFEGIAEIDPQGADLLASGGVLGRMRQANTLMGEPTRLQPLGLLVGDHGEVVNIAQDSLPPLTSDRSIPVIAVVGTSMNAGKTTAVASLAHGLIKAGYRVAALKATGTGAFGDFNAYRDAGVPIVADFTDAGMASTYRQPLDRIEAGLNVLLAHAVAEGADVAIVELADGVFQEETAAILRASWFRQHLGGVMFAAPDALGAVGGVELLRRLDVEPFAISGKVSCSPLATAEASGACGVAVVSREGLLDPEIVMEHVGGFIENSSSQTGACQLTAA